MTDPNARINTRWGHERADTGTNAAPDAQESADIGTDVPHRLSYENGVEVGYARGLDAARQAVAALRGAECDAEHHAEDNGPNGGWSCCMDFDAAIDAIDALREGTK